MSDSIKTLQQILQGPSGLNNEIDPQLTTKVSAHLKGALKDIQDQGLLLKGSTDLALKTTQLHQLQLRLLEFLNLVAHEFEQSEGRGLKLSIEQGMFYQQVIKTCIYHQTYLQLLSRRDVINQIYTRLSNLQLIRSNQIQDIETLLGASKTSGNQEFLQQIAQTTRTQFHDIKNLDNVIKAVQQVILLRPLALKSSYTFIMLTGPPGTGKTSLARAISNFHSNGTYFNLDISALLGQYVGQTEKRITELFQYVGQNRDKKFTIIMDELDIVLGEQAEGTTYLSTLRNSLQVALDPEVLGTNLVIVGMTNYFNKLNDVIKRRATNTFYIPLPTLEDSLKFLINEIEMTFYTFLVDVEIMPSNISPLSQEYINDVVALFNQYSTYRFSNANMRNIASSASSSAISGGNSFFNYSLNNRILKICAPNLNTLTNFEGISNSDTTDLQSVSAEIANNSNFFRYIFIVPSIVDIQHGIKQTPIMTLEAEQEFFEANRVSD